MQSRGPGNTCLSWAALPYADACGCVRYGTILIIKYYFKPQSNRTGRQFPRYSVVGCCWHQYSSSGSTCQLQQLTLTTSNEFEWVRVSFSNVPSDREALEVACSTTCASTCGTPAGLWSGKADTFWLAEGLLRDTGLLLLPLEVWLPCLPLRNTPGRVRSGAVG